MNQIAASTFTSHVVRITANLFLEALIGQILSTALKHQGDLIGMISGKNSGEILEELKLGNNKKAWGCSGFGKLWTGQFNFCPEQSVQA